MDQHPARTAPVPVLSLATHGAMLAGMAWAMLGGHAPGRSLLVGAALIALSLSLAPLLRHRAGVRDHVLDLWAMAGLLLVPLLASGARGATGARAAASALAAPAMDGMPGMGPLMIAALPVTVAIVLAWLGLRAWSMRDHARMRRPGISLRECGITAGVTGVGMLAMVLL